MPAATEPKLDGSPLIDRLLRARGIETKEDAAAFLAVAPEDWHDPFQMNDMPEAVERILTALGNKEKILICDTVQEAVAAADALEPGRERVILLENDLPDNY